MVLRVALVLIGEQDIEEAWIDIGARCRQSPAPFRSGVGPQQPAVAVDHHGGIGEPLPARRRAQREDPPGGSDHQYNGSTRNRQTQCPKARTPTFPPPLWGRDRERGGCRLRVCRPHPSKTLFALWRLHHSLLAAA